MEWNTKQTSVFNNGWSYELNAFRRNGIATDKK